MTDYDPTEGLGDEVERVVLHMRLPPEQREMLADALTGKLDVEVLPPRLREAAANFNRLLDEIGRQDGPDERLYWMLTVVSDLMVPGESKNLEDMSPDELEHELERWAKYPDPSPPTDEHTPVTGHSMRCADCALELDESYEQPNRKPCPKCGSTRREHFVSVHSEIRLESSVEAEVERGLNDTRLAVLGILVGIGLTVGLAVGFGVSSLAWGFLAGIGSFVLACVAIGWGRSRHFLMEFMYRLTGQ